MAVTPSASTLSEALKALKPGRSFKTIEIANLVGLASTHGLKVFVRPKGQGVILLLVTLNQRKGREDQRRTYAANWENGILRLAAAFSPGRQRSLIDQSDAVFLFTRDARPGDFTFQGRVKLLRGPAEAQKVAEFSFGPMS